MQYAIGAWFNKHMPYTPQPKLKTHKVRTFFASIFGIFAVGLIMISMTVVWLSRTLTDTSTFVGTVAPLATKPAIQTFVAQKVTDQLLNSAPTQDLAKMMIPAGQVTASMSDSQLKARLKPLVDASVFSLVRSPSFAQLWRGTIRSAHASLVSQLDSGDTNQLTLDLTPAVDGVITELKTTQLGAVTGQIKLKPGAGTLHIKSDKVAKIRQYYKLFKVGTIALVIVALAAAVLSAWLSVHHGKTVRRILVGVGVLALLQAVVLLAPATVPPPGADKVTGEAVRVVAEALVQNLLIANVVVGVSCILSAIGSKVYMKLRH